MPGNVRANFWLPKNLDIKALGLKIHADTLTPENGPRNRQTPRHTLKRENIGLEFEFFTYYLMSKAFAVRLVSSIYQPHMYVIITGPQLDPYGLLYELTNQLVNWG